MIAVTTQSGVRRLRDEHYRDLAFDAFLALKVGLG